MKLSLCNEVLRDWAIERQCAYAAALGYQGIELAPFTRADNPETLTERDGAAVASVAKQEGLEVSALHWLLAAPAGLSITAADPAVRARTLDHMKRLVGFAAAAGAGVLVHGSPKQRTLDDDPEGSAARGREAFHIAGGWAREAGVTYAIEPLSREETPFVTTVEEAASIVSEFGGDGLATMIDTCASAKDGHDPAQLIATWLPKGVVVHIHVNDANRRGPGQGAVDFAPIVDALKAARYGGWVSVEPFEYVPDGPGSAARAAGVMRTLIDGAR